MRITVCLLVAILSFGLVSVASADLVSAQKALQSGKHKKAVELFTPLAEAGDGRAAVTIGLIYQTGGNKVKQDYAKAYEWYLKALDLNNGDALNNLGVMHRDGQGVPQNRRVAYLAFLTVHMLGLGDGGTQSRANANLRREVAELPKSELEIAVCYSRAYFWQQIKEKGAVTEMTDELRPGDTNPRIKDMNFWTRSEREAMNFDCDALNPSSPD